MSATLNKKHDVLEKSFFEKVKSYFGYQKKWEFLRHVRDKNFDGLERYYNTIEKAAMNSVSGTEGGFLLPQQYSMALMDTAAEYSIFRPRALVVPTQARELVLPFPRITGTNVANTTTPYFGGITFSWKKPEGLALSETEPTFSQNSMVAKDLIGILVASNSLVNDIGEEGEMALLKLFGRAAAWYEDYAFFNGDGITEPQGILSAPCTIASTRAGSSTIAQVDIAVMASKLLPYSWSNSIWCCSPSALAKIAAINTFFPYHSGLNTPIGAVGTLLSRPLYVTEKLPTLGTLGDLVLFDPTLYVIADRKMITVDISPHANFITNQMTYRVWIRVDGRPALENKVTGINGDQVSSVVVLAA